MNFTIYVEKDLRSNESRDHYHMDCYLVPSPLYGFRFEAVSRLSDLNLTISVYLQSWPKNMDKTAKNGLVLDTTSNVQPI